MRYNVTFTWTFNFLPFMPDTRYYPRPEEAANMEEIELLIVGCGPAGATAAREAARRGIETVVLEKDPNVGERRVCAAGLRPGFCAEFDLPRRIVHCDTSRLALFDASGAEYELHFGPAHTSTREELDAAMAQLAQSEGAEIRTRALFRGLRRERRRTIVEYADLHFGARRYVAARNVFVATGASARIEASCFGKLAMAAWPQGLMTTLQYRVYLDRPAVPVTYQTLELHYYQARDGRQIVAWMFPKRDHLAIGLGVMGKIEGQALRCELDAFATRVKTRLYPHAGERERRSEGNLLYGGAPRCEVADAGILIGGTAAGLVDATNGEGIFEAAMSGRLAADAVVSERNHGRPASARYRTIFGARFRGRLTRRVRLMRYLERRPGRFGALFAQLARTPRLSDVLLKEDCERTMSERLFLYQRALEFGIRTIACRG